MSNEEMADNLVVVAAFGQSAASAAPSARRQFRQAQGGQEAFQIAASLANGWSGDGDLWASTAQSAHQAHMREGEAASPGAEAWHAGLHFEAARYERLLDAIESASTNGGDLTEPLDRTEAFLARLAASDRAALTGGGLPCWPLERRRLLQEACTARGAQASEALLIRADAASLAPSHPRTFEQAVPRSESHHTQPPEGVVVQPSWAREPSSPSNSRGLVIEAADSAFSTGLPQQATDSMISAGLQQHLADEAFSTLPPPLESPATEPPWDRNVSGRAAARNEMEESGWADDFDQAQLEKEWEDVVASVRQNWQFASTEFSKSWTVVQDVLGLHTFDCRQRPCLYGDSDTEEEVDVPAQPLQQFYLQPHYPHWNQIFIPVNPGLAMSPPAVTPWQHGPPQR